MKQIRVVVESLGCKLNQAEAELFGRQLSEAGYRLVSSAGEADVYILNTCTVTHVADRKSRHLLRMVHRLNTDVRLVAVGCYAEQAPEELAQIEGVALVLGNEDKTHLAQKLAESGCLNGLPSRNIDGCVYNSHRTRSFIKVQEGCYNFCAYCMVPMVRRGEKSVPAEQVIAEVRQQVAAGFKEVVLTGTRIGAYNSGNVNLKDLLERILAETEIARLRLSSLQPQELSPELIRLWHDTRLCPHFHMSLQSGSGEVLGRMKRRYSATEYRQAVSMIREVVPEAAITTDIIVGFPGETEAEFQESHDFCRQMEFARVHVFSYSLRRGTEAARMDNQVGAQVKKQRSRQMLALARESAKNFYQRFLGRTMPVLWEQKTGGVWSGLTGSYIKVYTRDKQDLTNQLVPVRLKAIRDDGLWGGAAGE